MKYRNINILLWTGIFVVLFIFLQTFFKFHFYYIEQNQLFLFDWDFIRDTISQVGGLSELLGDFLLQFFLHPYAGALIVTMLLLLISIATAGMCKQISPSQNTPLLYFLPALTLLPMIYNFNYIMQGTISYLLCVIALYAFMRLKQFKFRLIYAVILIPLLYYIAGSISILFAASILLKEILDKPRKAIWFLIPAAVAVLIPYLSMYWGAVGEYRFAYLTDMYFHNLLKPGTEIYFSWISLLLVILLSGLLSKRKKLTGKSLVLSMTAQFIIIGFLGWYGYDKYSGQNAMKYKEIEYYSRTGQWDKIIEINQGPINNYLYLCYLNMALARNGELAERAFTFDQRGTEGIMLQSNRTHSVSQLLSDIHFTFGNIAASQEQGFEANLSSMRFNCGYMLQRLVQTNLILGEYAVAEKYIDILSKTHYYKKWAEEHRHFLNNDQAIADDNLLGLKRKLVPAENYFYQVEGMLKILESNAVHYPQDKTSIDYLGVICLMSKEMSRFQEIIDKYYGTKVLPTLPRSFQEAQIILLEKQPDKWAEAGISPETIKHFNEFGQFILQNQKRGNLSEMVQARFGNTYWYYYMFK